MKDQLRISPSKIIWLILYLRLILVDHWTDLKRGLSEVHRVLKPNGTFVVVKDLDVPEAKKRIAELKTKLESSCFSILDQRDMNKEGIKFVLIICTGRKI